MVFNFIYRYVCYLVSHVYVCIQGNDDENEEGNVVCMFGVYVFKTLIHVCTVCVCCIVF